MNIIPALFAFVTGTNRYVPDFEWATKSWTHNIFRSYEYIFGRRDGLKIEMSARTIKGKVYYACYSWEAVCALTEQYIRAFFSSWELVPIKVYAPALANGVTLSPYVFAIALDNHKNTGYTGASALSFAYTSTGSNLVMVSGVWHVGGTTQAATPTYNSISLVNASNDNSSVGYNIALRCDTLVAPATGSNTFACSSTQVEAEIVTFSGAKQSGQPDSVAKVNTEGSITNTTLATVTITNNCMAVCFHVSSGGEGTAGTNVTELDVENASVVTFAGYSGVTPITPAGSYSMTVNHADGPNNLMSNIAISPFAAAVVTSGFRTLLGVGI